MRERARALLHEERNRLGNLTHVAECIRWLALGEGGCLGRLDRRVDGEQGDVDALAAQLLCGGLDQRLSGERARRPQPLARNRAARGATSDLD